MPSQPFNKLDLVQEVTAWVRHRILAGEFAVASVLPSEGELARILGVSRNVVREAMRNLRAQGLVEVSQGKRPRVKAADSEAATTTLEGLLRASTASLQHLVEARASLEVAVAATAAKRIGAKHLQALQADLHALQTAKSRTKQVDADLAFHRHLVEATGNPVYKVMLGSVSTLLRDLLTTTYQRVDLDRAIHSHQQLLQALRNRDPAAAGEAMRTHMQDSMQDLQKATTPSRPHLSPPTGGSHE